MMVPEYADNADLEPQPVAEAQSTEITATMTVKQ